MGLAHTGSSTAQQALGRTCAPSRPQISGRRLWISPSQGGSNAPGLVPRPCLQLTRLRQGGLNRHRKHEYIALIHAKHNVKTTSEHKIHERVANFTKRTHAQSQKSLSEVTGYANAARSQTQKQTRGERRQRARLHGAAPGPDERADSGFRAACS